MAESADLQNFKKNVRAKLDNLVPIFAAASIGDFSKDVPVGKTEDEFTEFYVGIQIMLEVIREKISELEKLNGSLEQSVKERTAALAEAQRIAHVGSWSWDMATNKMTWSNELYNIFGVKPKKFEATYEGYLKYVHPADIKRVDSTIRRAIKQAQPFETVHKIVNSQGAERIIHSHGETVLDTKTNKVVGISGTAQDITEEHKIEEEVLKRSKELERINSLMVGRELKMIELKKKVAALEAKLKPK